MGFLRAGHKSRPATQKDNKDNPYLKDLQMTKIGIIVATLAVALVAACSKPETPPNPTSNSTPTSATTAATTATATATAATDTHAIDYKKICGRLQAVAPESRQASLLRSCEKDYQTLLPSCQNAAAVTDCFTNIKTWDERLACLDSCVRTSLGAK